MEEKPEEWETLKEKLKNFVLYWWRTKAHLNCDFDVLLGKTGGSRKGRERMSAGRRQECWRGAAEPGRVGPTAQRREGDGRQTWEPRLGEEEGKTGRWEKPSSHHHWRSCPDLSQPKSSG